MDIRCEAVKKVLFSVEGEQDFLSPYVRRNQGNTALSLCVQSRQANFIQCFLYFGAFHRSAIIIS